MDLASIQSEKIGFMSGHLIRVLLIEDDVEDAYLVRRAFSKLGAEQPVLTHFDRLESGLNHLAEGHTDMVLLDLLLPDSQGIETLRRVNQAAPGMPIVVLSGMSDDRMTMMALREGAQDYLNKGRLDGAVLLRSVRYAIERKRTLDALGESEQNYKQMVELSPDAILVISEDRIVFANNAAVKLRATPDGAPLTGQFMDAFIHPDYRGLVGEYIIKAFQGDRPVSTLEAWFLRADETILDVEMAGMRVSYSGSAALQIGIRDVTERKHIKRLEEQLRQSQKMEAVGRLAGGVAHDFNNLLTAILGYSQLLLIDCEEGNPHKGQLEEILKAGQRGAALTRQLLVFSRRQVIQTRVFDLNTSIVELQKMLRMVIGEDINLLTELDSRTVNIRADSGQMEQVVMNLVVNARDAMPRGGEIKVKTDIENVDEMTSLDHALMRPGRYVTLSVTDDGCGIDPATRSRVFEPFFTTKEKGKGTGLGLSTVYGIVEQGGGHIHVTSDLGVGSTFKVYMPEASELADAQERKETRPVNPEPNGGQVILLVDDDAAICLLASTILRNDGYMVIEACSGDDGLKKAEQYQGQIDLVLTDVVLPGVSGRVLAERMSAIRPGIKVLYMSGYADDALLHHSISEGMPFLSKPFTLKELTGKVRHVFSPPQNSAGSAKELVTTVNRSLRIH